MPKVNVLRELLEWSKDRPLWQRDALRRLVTKGNLHDQDLVDITSMCKSEHGLGARVKSIPLEQKHISHPGARSKPVSLNSLTHHSGVNALAQEQKIEFGPGLTIVYGANAAGKSGYTRILKRACRARGSEEILGNVMSGGAPGRPAATIQYTVDNKTHDLLWDDPKAPNLHLAGVSVFDRHCASVYLSEQTDVAFRPLGLDLFDKISKVCEDLKSQLEQERRALAGKPFQFPAVGQGTLVHELVNSLTSLTDVEEVKKLSSSIDEDKSRKMELRAELQDLQSEDPRKKAGELDLRRQRAEVLVERICACVEDLGDASIEELFRKSEQARGKHQAAESLQRQTFEAQPLAETGSEAWRELWDAAARFSTRYAYPDHGFPFTDDDARCVLCQQELSDDGKQRLSGFRAFLASSVQRDYEKSLASFGERLSHVSSVTIQDSASVEALRELDLDNPELAVAVRTYLEEHEERRRKVIELAEGSGGLVGLP